MAACSDCSVSGPHGILTRARQPQNVPRHRKDVPQPKNVLERGAQGLLEISDCFASRKPSEAGVASERTAARGRQVSFVSLTKKLVAILRGQKWWADRDSNPDSKDYESSALTVKLSARSDKSPIFTVGRTSSGDQAKS
jgi:hypothetical protein